MVVLLSGVTWIVWRTGKKQLSGHSTRVNEKSCTWGEITLCGWACWGLTTRKADEWKTLGSWWTTGHKWQKRPRAFWAALGRALPAGQGRGSVPSALMWCAPSTVFAFTRASPVQDHKVNEGTGASLTWTKAEGTGNVQLHNKNGQGDLTNLYNYLMEGKEIRKENEITLLFCTNRQDERQQEQMKTHLWKYMFCLSRKKGFFTLRMVKH